MKLKKIGYLIVFTLIFGMSCMFITTDFSGNLRVRAVEPATSFAIGEGTIESPYQIQTEEEFLLFKNDANYQNMHFILKNDLVISAYLGDGTNGSCNMFNFFNGTLNGNNHTITFLDTKRIVGNNFGGIVGTLGSTYQLSGPNEYGNYTYTEKTGIIKNIKVIANFNVIGNNVGGIVGKVQSSSFSPSHSYANVTIDGSALNQVEYQGNLTVDGSYVGGVVGEYMTPSFDLGENRILQFTYNGKKAIENVKSNRKNTISGKQYVGGVVGAVTQGPITTSSPMSNHYFQNISYAAPSIGIKDTAGVKGTSDYIGGIVGKYDRLSVYDTPLSTTGILTIDSSAGSIYSEEDVVTSVLEGRNYVGGIVGYFGGHHLILNENTQTNILTTLNGSYIGGLFGELSLESYDSLFENRQVFATNILTPSRFVGGIVGRICAGGHVQNVVATVNIDSTGEYVGGATGQLGSNKHAAQLSDVIVYGSIRGLKFVGGLIGDAYVEVLKNSSGYHVQNCTSYASVSGGGFLGGIVGGFSDGIEAKNFKINNTWMAGEVDLDIELTRTARLIQSNYVYWGSFYGYQHKELNPTAPTTVHMTNSGTILDVTIQGEHKKLDVFGMKGNLSSNVSIIVKEKTESKTVYQIKAVQGADLGIDNQIYGFISNYNGQLLRIEKTSQNYVYISNMDRINSKFITDFDIDVNALTSYNETSVMKTDITYDSNQMITSQIVYAETAKQLERLAYILQYFIPNDGGLTITGPTDAAVNILLTKNNAIYDLTTSVGYYGENNFYGFGWSSFGPFMGKMDGKGNTIKVNMNCPDGFSIGVFGAVSSNAGGLNASESTNEFKNLTIIGRVEGNTEVGALVGFHDNYAPSTLLNNDRLSTLVVNSVVNMAEVEGKYIVGGIVGYSNSASTLVPLELQPYFNEEQQQIYEYNLSGVRVKLTDCTNYANVSSTGDLGTGGIIGALGWNVASSIYINSCTSIGDVSTTGIYAGGFIGYSRKAIILEGKNEIYGNVYGEDYSGLVYGYSQNRISYTGKISSSSDETKTYTIDYVPNLDSVTAYYCITLGDMSEKIKGELIQIDGEAFTFSDAHLFKKISWNYDKYALYDLGNWKVSGVNTIQNLVLIESYQGKYEKEPLRFECDATTLRYELNIIKNITYSEENSILEKIYQLDTDSYDEEWTIKALITHYDDSTELLEMEYDTTNINEDSDQLEFFNVKIDDPRYILNVDNIVLRRITKEIIEYEFQYAQIQTQIGKKQKEQFKIAETAFENLLSKYGTTNTYLNTYLNQKEISKTYLDKWRSIIVAEIEIVNAPTSVTYGTKYANYEIRYKTIDGKYASQTTRIVVSYNYSENNDTLSGVMLFDSVIEGSRFYQQTLDGLTATYEFSKGDILLEGLFVTKRTLNVFIANATVLYNGKEQYIIPTVLGDVEEDQLKINLLYNDVATLPINAGTYHVTIGSITGNHSSYYSYDENVESTLTIEQIEVSVLANQTNFIYNGKIQKPALTITNNGNLSEEYYQLVEVESKLAGFYNTEIILLDTTNYCFSLLDMNNIEYQIEKKEVMFELPKTIFIKGTILSEVVPSFTGLLEEVEPQIKVTNEDNQIVDANQPLQTIGNYFVEYVFDNYYTNKLEITVVDSIQISSANIEMVETSGMYSGIKHNVELNIEYDGNFLQINVDYTIEYLTDFKNVGNHQFQISGKGIFAGQIVKTYEITKADSEILTVDNQEFIYTGNALAPVVSTNVGNIPLEYLFTGIDGTNYPTSKVVPTQVGRYSVVISGEGTDNYNAPSSVTITYSIVKATSKIEVDSKSCFHVYNGRLCSVVANLNHSESTLIYQYVNATYDSMIPPVNAGTYTVIITALESTNYLETSITITMEIAKQTLEFSNVIDQFIYDGMVKTVLYQLPIDNLTVKGNVERQNATLDNGIAYELVIENLNYQGSYKGYLHIAKAIPSYNLPNVKAKYNQKLSEIILPIGFVFENPMDLVGNAGGIRYHMASYTPEDTLNYEIVTGILVPVLVEKATPEFSIPQNILTVYGDIVGTIELPLGFAFENPMDLVGNAGQQTHYISYTPEDTANYIVVEHIPLRITVQKASQTLTGIEIISLSQTSVTFSKIDGARYRLNGGVWTVSNTFTNLVAGSENKVEVYLVGDENHYDSDTIELFFTTTSKTLPTITNFENIVTEYDVNNHSLYLNPISNSDGMITYGFASDSARDVITLSGNQIFILNAGVAKLVLYQAETEDFASCTKVIMVTIEKANPKYEIPTGLVASYGQTLGEIVLPQGFNFQNNDSTLVGVVGNQKFLIQFTPNDLRNYKVVNNIEVLVTVIRAVPTVHPQLPSDMIYTSSPIPKLTLLEGDTNGNISLDKNQPWIIGKHLYTWSFVPYDSMNYESLTGSIEIEVLEVQPVRIEVTTLPVHIEYTAFDRFDSLGMVVTVYYNDGSKKEITDYSYDETPLSAIQDKVEITYGNLTTSVSIIVNKKHVEFTNIVDHFVYDGSVHEVNYKIENGNLTLNVIGNVSSILPVEGITYTLQVDDINYEGTYSGVMVVEKAIPSYTIPDVDAIYLDTLGSILLPSQWKWKDEASFVGDAGINLHYATYTPDNLDLYKIVEDIEIPVKVNKRIPVVPEIRKITVSFGTKLLDIGLPSGFRWIKPELEVGNVGTHRFFAQFVPSDTKNYQIVDIQVEVEVTKIPFDKPIVNVVSQTTNSITLTQLSNALYRIDGGNWQSSSYFEGLTPAKNYVIEVYYPGDENHSDSEILKLEISLSDKILPTISNFEDITTTYHNQLTIIFTPTTNSSGKLTYQLDDESSIASLNGNTLIIHKAGTITVTLHQDETESFASVNKTISITILKAKPNYEVPKDIVATYLDLLSSVQLPTGFVFQDIDLSTTLVGNAGLNSFRAMFIPEDTDSYEIIRDIEITIQVNKKEAEATVSYEGGKIFTSAEQLPELTILSSNTKGKVELMMSLPLQAGTAYYRYSFIPEDSQNYEGFVDFISLTIVRPSLVSLRIDNKPTKLQYVAFETFDSTGMVLMGLYDDGKEKEVTQYEIQYQNGKNSFLASDQNITFRIDEISIQLEINVSKKVVTFENIRDTYTYDGLEHTVTYETSVKGIKVVGAPTHVDATSLSYQLQVIDENYQGVYDGIFTIQKAKYQNITHPDLFGTYDELQTLNDFNLNMYFRWVTPNLVPTVNQIYYTAIYNQNPNNFEDYEFNIKITLNPKELHFHNVVDEFTYDGNPHSVLYELEVENLNVIGNLYQIDYTSGLEYHLIIMSDNYCGETRGILKVNKATPIVHPYYEGVLYPSSDLPKLSLSLDSTPGTIILDANQILIEGIHEYNYSFVPTDTVNYIRVEGKIPLTVSKIELVSVHIEKEPNRIQYKAFEIFENDGTIILAYYSDGSSKIVTDYTFEAYVVVDLHKVVYTYEENGIIQSVTLNLNVEKQVPLIHPYYDKTLSIYPTSKLPILYLGEGDTKGIISLNTSNVLEVGTKEYNYTFIPQDRTNYLVVEGKLEITVLAVELVSIRVDKNPDKMIYDAFDVFDKKGMIVVAVYNDGNEQMIQEYQISANLRYDNRVVTIQYQENDVVVETKLEVEVNKKMPILHPFYESKPLYTSSNLPELFLLTTDTKGNISWNEDQKLVSGTHQYFYHFVPMDNINYHTVTSYLELEVLDVILDQILVTTLPEKLIYVSFETFKTEGMIVTAYYNDGSQKEVSNYQIRYHSNETSIRFGDTHVVVTYENVETLVEVEVNKATLQDKIVFENVNYTYDGILHQLYIENLPEGVLESHITYTNNRGLLAGTYNAKVVIDAPDYEKYETSAVMTIEKRQIMVTSTGLETAIYTGNHFANTMIQPVYHNVADVDLNNLDNLLQVTYYKDNQKIDKYSIIDVGNYQIIVSLTPLALQNYTLEEKTLTFRVTPFEIKVDAIYNHNLIYDGKVKYIEEIIKAESKETYLEYKVRYLNENNEVVDPIRVGKYFVMVESTNTNFVLHHEELSFMIVPRKVEIDFGVLNTVYNGLNHTYLPKIKNLVDGDLVELEYQIFQNDIVVPLCNAGKYTIFFSTLNGEDASQYELEMITKEYTIEKRNVEIVYEMDMFEYNGDIHTPKISFKENQKDVNLVYFLLYTNIENGTTSETAPIDAGKYRLAITGLDFENNSFDELTTTKEFEIQKRSYSIRYPENLTYNGKEQLVEVIFNHVLEQDLSSFVSYVDTPNQKMVENAGQYTIFVETNNSNYQTEDSKTAQLIVNRLSVTLSVQMIKTKVSYSKTSLGGWGANEIFEVISSYEGDVPTQYHVRYRLDENEISVEDVMNVGTYTILLDTVDTENIDYIVQNQGKLTIEPLEIKLYSDSGTGPQIRIYNDSLVYNGNVQYATYEMIGLLDEDQVQVKLEYSTYDGQFILPKIVGTYKVIVKEIDNPNYRLPNIDIVTYMDIIKREVNVIVDSQSSIYGNPLVEHLTYQHDPILEGDEIRGSLKTVANAYLSGTSLIEMDNDFGIYNQDTNAINENYELIFTKGIYEVEKRELSISLKENLFQYNGKMHQIEFITEGGIRDDVLITSYNLYRYVYTENGIVKQLVQEICEAGLYEVEVFVNIHYQIVSELPVQLRVVKPELTIEMVTDESVYTGEKLSVAFRTHEGIEVMIRIAIITYNGDIVDEIRNAGVYSIEAYIDDENYEGTATFNFTVHKAKYNGITHEDIFITYQENLNLGDIELETGFEFLNNEDKLTVAMSGQKFSAIYNEDKENYEDYELEILIYVGKAKIEEFEFINQSFIYDGNEHSLVINNLPKGILNVHYQNNRLTHVGSILVSAEFEVDENYQKVPSKSATLSITPKEITILPRPNQFKLYSEDNPNYTFEAIGLLPNDQITGNLSRTEGENVGTYTYLLGTLDAGSNYTLILDNKTNMFEVRPYQIDHLTLEEKQFVYDGNEKTLALRIEGMVLPTGIYYQVENNLKLLHAGKYRVKIICENMNYILSPSCTSFEVEILKQDVNSQIQVLSQTHVYTGNIMTGFITCDYNFSVLILKNNEETELQNVGTYTISVTINETDYRGEKIFVYTITKASQNLEITKEDFVVTAHSISTTKYPQLLYKVASDSWKTELTNLTENTLYEVSFQLPEDDNHFASNIVTLSIQTTLDYDKIMRQLEQVEEITDQNIEEIESLLQLAMENLEHFDDSYLAKCEEIQSKVDKYYAENIIKQIQNLKKLTRKVPNK